MTAAPLPQAARDVLMAIARRAGEHAETFARQVDHAVVTEDERTWIYFSVPRSQPRLPWRDGVIPMGLNPGVVESGEPTSEVLVWVEDGRLCAMEHPWFTDDPPAGWPRVDDLVWDLGR